LRFGTKNQQWLLERVDSPQVDYLKDVVEPMLGSIGKSTPVGDYVYEVKWDGIRAMIAVEDGVVRIRSRNQRDITEQFPELLLPEQSFRCSTALFDGEIVCIDDDGKPVFQNVIHRIRQRSERAVKRAGIQYPAVCYLFDCLYLDGRPILNDPLYLRREWLADSIRRNAENPYRLSESVEDGEALFSAACDSGLEGIMAKDRQSVYQPGRRTAQWMKIKSRQTMECMIIGYTQGRGDRSSSFGALQLARPQDDNLKYMGKVGTGFSDRVRRDILKELKKVSTAERSVREKPVDDAVTTWLEPKLVCEVQYASLTNAGTLREPVFLRLRPDLQDETAQNDSAEDEE
jgi:DNA ligase D-like protein (predicted ligase)